MIREKEMLHMCLNKGAHKAFMIDVDKIPFDEKLRAYCQEDKCGFFGKNYACPPHIGETKELIEEAKTYKSALVIQTIGSIIDFKDFEGVKIAHENHNNVSNLIAEELIKSIDSHLDLRAGPCTVCEKCTIIDDEACKYPEKKRASLEAYCINVSSLAQKCGMEYTPGKDKVSFFGAFLFN